MTIRIAQTEIDQITERELIRLRHHTATVRNNLDVVAVILDFLTEDPPNASAAAEILELCDHDTQIGLWSQSPTKGGIWPTWMREALKTGELGKSYDVWLARSGRPDLRGKQ